MSRIFDAVDDVIIVAANATIDNLTTQSWCFWMYVIGAGENNFGYVMSKAAGVAGPRLFTNDSGGSNGLGFGFHSSTANRPSRTTDFAMYNLNQWTFVCGTHDGSVTGANIHIYRSLNGTGAMTEVTYSETNNGTVALADNSGSNLFIGDRGDSIRSFNGKLAHYQIFNRVISIKEMEQVRRFPGALTNGLVGFLPFRGQSPEADLSGNNNDGVVTGALVDVDPPGVYPPLAFNNRERAGFPSRTGRYPVHHSSLMADSFALGKAPAAGGVTVPIMDHHYRQMRYR